MTRTSFVKLVVVVLVLCLISGTNLTNIVYSKGANCVIGYTESVYTRTNYTMKEAFCSAIGAGYSIAEALVYADAQVLAQHGESGYTNCRYVLGDTSVRLADQIYFIGSSDSDTSTMSVETIVCAETQNGYIDPARIANNDMGSLTDLELEILAEEKLAEVCENVEKYELTSNYYTEDTGITTYVYTYRISGFDTGDYVYVMLNSNGEVVAWGKQGQDSYDNVALSPSDIQNAYAELDNMLKSGGHHDYMILGARLLWKNDMIGIQYAVQYTNSDGIISIDDYFIFI